MSGIFTHKLMVTHKVLTISMVFICSFFIASNCLAAVPFSDELGGEQFNQEQAFSGEAGFNIDVSVGDIVGTAVKAFLGFLGTVFLVLMVIGGWKYMMARGNEEQVTEAIGLIRRAIIGLIIVAGAYSITYFVFNAIDWVGGGGGGGNPVGGSPSG
ncbi:hypothetical protein COV49_04130 [Candidatus Falkowbacteria bacterium CG11_big_fil_rev_8_21_14_0_20_39_10]|uniref:Uncharacterized protein n=1 Tax=Candidatus Falkowbacteria bacterium CG11_big_fil_rev_8_21_14_0_20_39_10 TaxID=1974570 RepID=A0A2M6K811_9BACT|nr:MAG: hypothetical protein COV49_04130 [Candidatus Falkowbacteria bacterium CG11_big_fil_rev_8_21_14_0_20_39_10]